jgi:hypothetical protein
LDNSWAHVFASNGPKRKIDEGVSMTLPPATGKGFDRAGFYHYLVKKQ